VDTGFWGWRLTGNSWKIKREYKNVNTEKILMMDQLKNMTVFILIWPKRILKHVNSVQSCSYDHGVLNIAPK